MGATESIIDSSKSGGNDVVAGARLHLALRCRDLTAAPVSFALKPGLETVVGRNDDDDQIRISPGRIALPDRWLSSKHFSLSCSPEGRWRVLDLKSKNGTLVNGQPARSHPLEHRDVVCAGSSVLLLLTDGGASPQLPGAENLPPELLTDNHALAGQLERLVKIAPTLLSVLVRGETGAGKEVFARAVHRMSGRKGSFVPVNCGAIPESLLEAQLFGAVKGAYTGASEATEGFIRAADGGTLFLDEIAELHAASQVALLRVLEEREVIPVGATRAIPVDLRVVAATHQPVEERIATGDFREDLYARLRGFELALPPLRERPEDIGRLIAGLLPRVAPGRTLRLHPAAATPLFRYGWPRNVRELRNALSSACALCEDDEIALGDLPDEIAETVEVAEENASGESADSAPRSPSPALPVSPAKARVSGAGREAFRELVHEHGGNVSAIARAMGTSRSQVRRLLARHGIDANDYRR